MTAATTPVPRRRLAIRLAWLTVASILLAQALFVIPVLVRQRQDWLDRRLTEAQLAAHSATLAAAGTLDAGTRAELLRLALATAISLDLPDEPPIVLSADGTLPASTRVDPRQESIFEGVANTAAALFAGSNRLISVEGASTLREGGTIVTVLPEQNLHNALLRQVTRIGSISLGVAAAVALLLYLALLVTLVRPMRRLTASIAAFRADPERSAPLDAARFAQGRNDEIATAAHELAAMQRELRAALWRNARLAALGTAMAKVNHDLRGILSPAMLTAERLQMSADPSVKRAGDVLVRSVERATELARRTLDFARETPVSLPLRPMPLHPAVEEAAEQARAACPMLQVANHVVAGIEIEADHESLVRVLGNLLRNAGEADALRVTVSAAQQDNELVIVVADDGPGLPEPVRAALFRPFVAGGRRGSTGLGLAIVHDLVRAHGGMVTLLETGPAGTSFRVTLPQRSFQPAA